MPKDSSVPVVVSEVATSEETTSEEEEALQGEVVEVMATTFEGRAVEEEGEEITTFKKLRKVKLLRTL